MKNPRNNKMKASPPAKTIADGRSVIVPFMKTHSTKNPFDPNSPDVRTRTYQHPNKRFKATGSWDKR